jgi:hypothetical protein
LRPGIRAHITLPEALTEKEAMRVARFVQSLALSSDQPAITAGEAVELFSTTKLGEAASHALTSLTAL